MKREWWLSLGIVVVLALTLFWFLDAYGDCRDMGGSVSFCLYSLG